MPNPTARELLELVAGTDHALHSVAGYERSRPGVITLVCSCDETFPVEANTTVAQALRNVTKSSS